MMKLRTRSRLLLALPAAALALSLAACGGVGAAERPSAAKVADGLQQVLEDNGADGALTEPMLLCLSKAMVESDLSDQDLANIAEGKDVQTSTEAYDLMQKVMTDAAPGCITAE